jgi:hypothetical protein
MLLIELNELTIYWISRSQDNCKQVGGFHCKMVFSLSVFDSVDAAELVPPLKWRVPLRRNHAKKTHASGPRGRGPSRDSLIRGSFLTGRDGGLAVRRDFSAEYDVTM